MSQLPYNSQDSMEMRATGNAEMAEVSVVAAQYKSEPGAVNAIGDEVVIDHMQIEQV